MKKFSEFVNESTDKKKIKLKDKPVNYLSEDELKKYLEIADNFLSDEAKDVCNWLIDNNDYYKKNINSLLDFFNSGSPSQKELKKLYSNINKVNDTGRVKEIPVFMTKKEFEDVVNKKIPADLAIMDFETEAGRNEIAKRYIPLVHKIANSWVGKTALTRDELFEAGMHGLADAMKDYGQPSKKAKKNNKEIDIEKYTSYTFLQLAAQRIRIVILETIKDESHLVRIPRSKQAEEKEKKGYNTKSNSVSGDTPMGSKDGGIGKSLFDLVGDVENPTIEMDKREVNSLWDQIMNELTKKFGYKTMDIFKNHFGFNLDRYEEVPYDYVKEYPKIEYYRNDKSGDDNSKFVKVDRDYIENHKDEQYYTFRAKKLSGKEMAARYNYNSASSITSEVTKVLNYIRKDSKIFKKFQDINFLTKEVKHDEDEYMNDGEPVYEASRRREFSMYGTNNIDGDD